MRFIALLLLAAAPLVAPFASAQDIPGRVGRVSYTDGPVAIYQDPDIGWEKAYVNSPVTSENSLWTEPRSRAELRVSAVALRLDGATQLDVSRLDDDVLHANLVRGSVALRVRHNEYGSRFAFDTPEARFTITAEGRYRIDVDVDMGETRLAVFAGEASMETSQGARRIGAGRMVRIAGGDYAIERADITAFDRWTQVRDRQWVERNSTRYVSTFMTGYEELDPYGEWIQDPEYGALWAPTRVAADWVPYRYGHWSYVRPWGWTWIDDQPWGYAPFHYGRWVHVRERWYWYPGRREARPAWAPALVAWVGGSNWSASVSGGSPVMGWYPLAPTEHYRPWYQASDRYTSRLNTIVINVGGNDRDRRGDRRDDRRDDRRPQDVNRTLAVTAMPRENMIERRPVQQSMVRVAPDAVRTAQAVQPQQVMPTTTEIQRMRSARARTAPASVAAPAAQAPAASAPSAQRPGAATAPAQAPSANAAISRGERGQQAPTPPLTAPQIAPGAPVAPSARPSFARPQAAPAPAPAPAGQAPAARGPREQSAPQPAPQAAQPAPQAAQPQANPLSRGNFGRERSEQVHDRNAERQQQQQQQQQLQQQQQEAQRAQQQQQQEAQRRAAEAQRAQQQQQQEAQRVQQQQQQQQEAQRRAAEAQQRAQQQQQQQQLQQQQEAQRRAAEAQQRAQQQQQQQQQEAQRRAAEAQQRAAQQRPQPPAPPAAQPPAAEPAPQAAPAQGNPVSRGQERRARPPGQEPDKDKDKDDKDKDRPGKGRRSGEGG